MCSLKVGDRIRMKDRGSWDGYCGSVIEVEMMEPRVWVCMDHRHTRLNVSERVLELLDSPNDPIFKVGDVVKTLNGEKGVVMRVESNCVAVIFPYRGSGVEVFMEFSPPLKSSKDLILVDRNKN